jgi:argininosuccinate lyase
MQREIRFVCNDATLTFLAYVVFMLTKDLGAFVTLLIHFARVAIEIIMWVTSEFG